MRHRFNASVSGLRTWIRIRTGTCNSSQQRRAYEACGNTRGSFGNGLVQRGLQTVAQATRCLSRRSTSVILTLLAMFLVAVHPAAATTVTITAAGSGSWTVPAGVTSITVECWGAGGGGDSPTSSNTTGGGGGGGAYAIVNSFAVSPGSYPYTVGTGGTGPSDTNPGPGTAGGASSFNNTTCVAVGGGGGGQGTGGTGGQASASTGNTKYSGGNGAAGNESNGYGGGGGGSAGTGSNGGNGSSSGYAGATLVTGGGPGGNGSNGCGGDGSAPTSGPGGGGGGACRHSGAHSAGNGYAGQIRITYTAPATKLAFTTNPSASTIYGSPFAQQPVVTVQDASGLTVTSSTDSITLTVSGGASVTGCTFNPLTAVAGVATFSGCQISAAANGYTLTATSGSGLTGATSSSFNITPKALTVSGITATNKTYDGTTAAPLAGTPGTLVGVVGSDVVSLAGTAAGAFANKNVQTAKAVTVSGQTLAGANAGNYTLTEPTGLTANITALPITVTAQTNTKTYDGTTTAAATPTITSGALQGSDTPSFTETYDNKNAGTGKTLTPAGTVADGNGGNNYTYTYVPDTTGVITARPLTVTAATNTKAYDGNTSASATPTITSGTLATGDTTTGLTETYDTKDVGTNKTLTPGGTVSDGNSGSNYSYTFNSATNGTINAKALTVTGLSATSKTYDGTNTAAITGTPVLNGALGGDDVTLSGTPAGTFSDQNVGNNKAVTVSGLSLVGLAASDYSLTSPSPTANIMPLSLTVSGITAADKVYDGTTTATLNTSGAALVGVLSGDTSTVTLNTAGATGTFASPNVGTGITVNVSGLTISGTSSANYSLTQPTTTASITQGPETTVLASSANPSASGQSVTFTATVTPNTATGTVTFNDGSTQIGTGPLSSGKATFSTSSLSVGLHSITAVYPGDSNVTGSTSSPLSQKVMLAPAVIATGSNSANNSRNVTISNFTVPTCSSPDCYLIVGVSSHNTTTGTPSISGVTWNGASLAPINYRQETITGGTRRVSLYQLQNPTPAINGSIVVSGSTGVNDLTAGAVLFSGVKTGGPASALRLGATTIASAQGNANPVSTSVTTAVGDTVLDTVTTRGDNGSDTPAAGQTQQFYLISTDSGGLKTGGLGSTKVIDSGTSTTMSWTLGSPDDWAIGAISLIPEAPASQLAFTAVNGGVNPTAGVGFPVVVQAQDMYGNPSNVIADTVVYLTRNTGNGAFSGNLNGTILSGSNSVTINGVVYDTAESNVSLTATTGDSSLAAGNSAPFTVNPMPTPTRLVITSISPASPTAGNGFSVTVQSQDINGIPGNVSAATDVTLSLNTGTGTLGGTLIGTMAAGSYQVIITGVTYTKAESNVVLRASGGTLTPVNSTGFTVIAGSATKLAYTTVPSSGTAGTAFSVTVQSQDAYGNPSSPTSNTTITLSKASGGGTLSGTLTGTILTSGNSVTISTPVYSMADTMTLTATATAGETSLTAITSGNITFSPGAANKLAFTTSPTSSTGGTPFPTQPVVTVQDANGNTVNSTASITLAITSGTGTTGAVLTCVPSNTLNASAGVAAFGGCSINLAGNNYTLRATSGSLTAATSTAFNIQAGPATKLGFSVQPSNTVKGTTINPAVQVQVQDAGGNLVQSGTASITMAIGTNPSGGTLSGTTPVSAVNGVATFSDLSIDQMGTGYTLTASSSGSGLTSATSSTFNITPAVVICSSNNGTGSPVTFSCTVPSTGLPQGDTYLVVGVSMYRGTQTTSGASVSGITWNGTSTFTKLGSAETAPAPAGSNRRMEIWQLQNPASGTHTVSVSGTWDSVVAGGLVFEGVQVGGLNNAFRNQTPAPGTPYAPFKSAVNASGSNPAALSSILTSPNDVVMDTIASYGYTGADAAGTGQTSEWHYYGSTTRATGDGSIKPIMLAGTTSTSTSWTLNGGTNNFQWAMGAVSVVPFSVGPPAQLAITSVNTGVSPTAGVGFPVVVQVQDSNGNPSKVTSDTDVSLSVYVGSGSLNGGAVGGTILSGTTAITVPGVIYSTAGTGVVLQATAIGGSLTAGNSAPFNVVGPPAKLAFTTQPSGFATGGTAFAQQPAVSVQDANGNTVPSSSAQISLAITAGTGTTGAALTCTPSNSSNANAGVALFAGCNINSAGSGYTLTATSSGSGLPPAISNPINVIVSGSNSGGGSTTITPFTVPPCTFGDCYLIVGVSTNGAVSSITWRSATGFVPLGTAAEGSGTVALYYLKNPVPDTNNIVVTLTGSNQVVAGAVWLGGVNRSTPFRSGQNTPTFPLFASGGNLTSAATVSVTTQPGDLVIDTVAVLTDPGPDTAGTGQTQLWSKVAGTSILGDGSLKQATSTATTMTWNLNSTAYPWAIGAIAVVPQPPTGGRRGQAIIVW